MKGQDIVPKKTLWTPNLNMDLTHMKRRENTEHSWDIRSVNINAPPQEENLYAEETSYEEKTAEKEIPSPWIGAPVKMTTVGWEERRGGEMKHPYTTRFHLHVLRSQSTTLIFPGLRELLTQTSGDIRRSSQSYPSMGGGQCHSCNW